MSGPIKPQDVTKRKAELFPQEVFKVFNDLIASNWDGQSSKFKKDEALTRIMSALNLTKNEVYARNYLDVEDVYGEAGWDVFYDKPGYNENYDATYTFTQK